MWVLRNLSGLNEDKRIPWKRAKEKFQIKKTRRIPHNHSLHNFRAGREVIFSSFSWIPWQIHCIQCELYNFWKIENKGFSGDPWVNLLNLLVERRSSLNDDEIFALTFLPFFSSVSPPSSLVISYEEIWLWAFRIIPLPFNYKIVKHKHIIFTRKTMGGHDEVHMNYFWVLWVSIEWCHFDLIKVGEWKRDNGRMVGVPSE